LRASFESDIRCLVPSFAGLDTRLVHCLKLFLANLAIEHLNYGFIALGEHFMDLLIQSLYLCEQFGNLVVHGSVFGSSAVCQRLKFSRWAVIPRAFKKRSQAKAIAQL
jgi:hypothetical protein